MTIGLIVRVRKKKETTNIGILVSTVENLVFCTLDKLEESVNDT